MKNKQKLQEAMSDKKDIEDPYSLTSELMDDMLFFIELKINNYSELSEADINEQLDKKHKLMIQVVVNDLGVMEEKAKE